MWSEAVEYLKDASLVAEIQKLFGVRIHYTGNLGTDYEGESSKKVQNKNTDNVERELNTSLLHSEESKENGYVISERKSVGVTDANARAPCDKQKQSSAKVNPNFAITNYVWYYLFLFGTELGDEIFYCTFIPFWFWNIDGAVGRRVVLVWAIVMTVGQMLKDVLCWPRPACPPAVRVHTKWADEYGMPSTHAMNGISIPFSVVLFTMSRYIYPVSIGWVIAIMWCTLVCVSRLYLGMHTVLDILAGLMLAIAMMVPLVPLVDFIDYYIFSNIWGLTILIAISIGTIVYYPQGKKWTPTRADSTMVVSVTTGIHFGTWLNYKTGTMLAPNSSPPYPIIWPSYQMFGCLILRTILGFCSIVATRIACKFLSYQIVCVILRIDTKDLMRNQNFAGDKNKVFVDLVHKYMTCFMIGVNTVYFLPNVFTMLGIERPSFYTEM